MCCPARRIATGDAGAFPPAHSHALSNHTLGSPFKKRMRTFAAVTLFAGAALAAVLLHTTAGSVVAHVRSTPERSRAGREHSRTAQGYSWEVRETLPASADTDAASDEPDSEMWQVELVDAHGTPVWNERICVRLDGDVRRTEHDVVRTDRRGRAKFPRPKRGALTLCVAGHLLVELTESSRRVTAPELVPVEVVVLDGATGRPLQTAVEGIGSHVRRGSTNPFRDLLVKSPTGFAVWNGLRTKISRYVDRVRVVLVARPVAPDRAREDHAFESAAFIGPPDNEAIGFCGCGCWSAGIAWRDREEERDLKHERDAGGVDVRVQLRHRDGSPVPSLYVCVDGPIRVWRRSRPDGTLLLPSMPRGEYRATASAPGFVRIDQLFVVRGHGGSDLVLEEPEGWTASVLVVDGAGRPVPFACVSVCDERDYEHVQFGVQTVGLYTDVHGRARFPRLDMDVATIAASRPESEDSHVKLTRHARSGTIVLE